MKKPIKLHWACSKPNFGDWLSPKIVECVSGRPVQYAPVEKCDLVAVGSLLQRVGTQWWNRRLHIWGTGFIETRKPRRCRHYVHAVRGPLSARILGVDDPIPYGDPGLLADRLLDGRSIGKRHRISIIAHYKDKGSGGLRALCDSNPDARIIDVFSDPMEILEAIAASHCVLSSAMHGLIAADALGVPNARVVFSDLLRGGGFKFRDYYQGIGVPEKVVDRTSLKGAEFDELLSSCERPKLARVKERLVEAFPSL